jgi:hypothetical protein
LFAERIFPSHLPYEFHAFLFMIYLSENISFGGLIALVFHNMYSEEEMDMSDLE